MRLAPLRLRAFLAWLPLACLAAPAPGPAHFVDEAGCARCHAAEARAWAGSHHGLAMQVASEKTVLGDFDGATFSSGAVTTRFFRRDGGFFVDTDGPDGRLADFRVTGVIGVDPLQQLLIDLPGGRRQAFPIAWDSGRKRWFNLYPGEHTDFRDALHWTRPALNWNFQCGECHTSGYRKNYDARTATYRSTAAMNTVGCQACHGPASRHAEWASHAAPDAPPRPREAVQRDFDVDLAGADPKTPIETCARCHARRGVLSADYRWGAPLMDTHLPTLLDEGVYRADGQIEAEDYEYGSFLQSPMYAHGLRCSDCHDPHTARLHVPGNGQCATCHNPTRPAARAGIDTRGLKHKDYDSPAHHFHQPGRPGSRCVDCHAPTRDYMVVHARHDHSFRIPRPDLTIAIGTPNACNQCHQDQTPQWAADAVARWYGPGRRQEPTYGLALDAGRRGRPGAVAGLVALVDDPSRPAIVRARALDLLARYPGRATVAALQGALRDRDPLVRHAAASGYESFEPADRIAPLASLLTDPVRAVRIEAARLLAPARLPADLRPAFDRALAEFVAAQTENADRPEALAALANLALGRGDTKRAEQDLKQALVLDRRFVPAYLNLADLQRETGRDAEAERSLRRGLDVAPGSAALHQALGLALVRRHRNAEALAELAAASEAAPEDARSAYLYAVALHDGGQARDARRVLESAAQRSGDRDLLLALAAYAAEAGDAAGARDWLHQLAAINPDDPALARPDGAR